MYLIIKNDTFLNWNPYNAQVIFVNILLECDPMFNNYQKNELLK